MTGQREPARWQRRLPNQLTGARVALALVFFAVLAPYQHASSSWRGSMWLPLAAAAIFIIAAVTDALDGRLARKWGVVSTFGRVMDPFADKVLVLGAFVLLAGPGFVNLHLFMAEAMSAGRYPARPPLISGVEPWMVVLILAREVLVTSLRGLVESRGGDFSATTSGKLKMILQCIAVPTILLLVALHRRNMEMPEVAGPATRLRGPGVDYPPVFAAGIAWITTLVTAWSAVPYVTRAIRVLRTPEKA